MYLIGDTKLPLDLKQDNVLVRVGGGSEMLDTFADRYHRTIERNLVHNMIDSSQSLEWVTDELMEGRKIKSPTLVSPVRTSPARITAVSPTRYSPGRVAAVSPNRN